MKRRMFLSKVAALAGVAAVAPSATAHAVTQDASAFQQYLTQELPSMLDGQKEIGKAVGYRLGYDEGLRAGLRATVESWLDLETFERKAVAYADGKYAAVAVPWGPGS